MLSVLPAPATRRVALCAGDARPSPFLRRSARSIRVAHCSATAEQEQFQVRLQPVPLCCIWSSGQHL